MYTTTFGYLTTMATTNIAAKKMAGVVVGAGRMMKTVKVRMAKEEWNRHLRKVSFSKRKIEAGKGSCSPSVHHIRLSYHQPDALELSQSSTY